MIFHWPQIIMLILMGLRLGAFAALDGKPMTGKNSFVAAFIVAAFIVTAFIVTAINFTILYQGGFWGYITP